MYYSPSFVITPPPTPNRASEVIFPMKIRPSNKFCKTAFQKNVNKATCVERSRSFIFIPSSSIDLLNQRKIVLARKIGHVCDTSLCVYHLDHHEVLFHL